MPYFKSYWYPGPPPENLTQPFKLSLPGPPDRWFYEPDTDKYRTPQNRHLWGPLPELPSVLLMETTIDIPVLDGTFATQGAIFLHQEYDYYGGPEFGWVYFGDTRRLAHYFCGNCNIKPGQRWRSKSTKLDPSEVGWNNSYLGRQIGLRLDLGTDELGRRTMRSRVYDVARTSELDVMYDLNETWPEWLEQDPRYDPSKPWWVTLTWQRQGDSPSEGSNSFTSVWAGYESSNKTIDMNSDEK